MAYVEQIPDDLKMGREYALLGNYDTSLVYYEGACQAIKKKVRLAFGTGFYITAAHLKYLDFWCHCNALKY